MRLGVHVAREAGDRERDEDDNPKDFGDRFSKLVL